MLSCSGIFQPGLTLSFILGKSDDLERTKFFNQAGFGINPTFMLLELIKFGMRYEFLYSGRQPVYPHGRLHYQAGLNLSSEDIKYVWNFLFKKL